MLISDEETVEGSGSTIKLQRKRRRLAPVLFDFFYPMIVVAVFYAIAVYIGYIKQ